MGEVISATQCACTHWKMHEAQKHASVLTGGSHAQAKLAPQGGKPKPREGSLNPVPHPIPK